MITSLKHYWFRLTQVPPAQWPGKIVGFGLRQIRELAEEALTRLRLINRMPKRLDSALVESLHEQQVPQLLRETLRERFFINPNQREIILTALREVEPGAEKLIVAEADRICDHVFDLLGSGPTPLGEKIDWRVDFKTGHRWNPKTYYKRIRPAPYPGGYDIKVPWELSRCQHFVSLGQAYWITGDKKYAREFVAQVSDWIESNPWPWGVNWACTMDVAIRAVNWLWGLAFFLDSPSLTDEFLLKMARSLLVHGRHIMNNLDGSREDNHTTNHYIADLVGLIYLGICCPHFKDAQRWLEFGTSELWSEMFKQIYPDGVDYEGSIPYHRLVTEFFLSAILLCRRNHIEVPQTVMERLEKMLEFIYHVTKPDGAVPIIGDQDNGRLHRLAVWAEPDREWVDYRYLLGIGAELFEREDFALMAGDQWQEAIWLIGTPRTQRELRKVAIAPSPKGLCSKAFTEAGFYVLCSKNAYMLVDLGLTGTNGIGNHTHANALGFELQIGAVSFIVDPGSYVYTNDWEARRLFRSAPYHNVLCRSYMNPLAQSEADLFRFARESVPDNIRWVSTSEYDLLEAQAFLGAQHAWTRSFRFEKQRLRWVITDLVELTASDSLMASFHLGPGICPRQIEDSIMVLSKDEGDMCLAVRVESSEPYTVEIQKTWVSPSYGIKWPSYTVQYAFRGTEKLLIRYDIWEIRLASFAE